ncbi:MAG TPA: DCC1-like thiol-disulfide oxidoreductase family protein [Nocardioides sp.]|nr:DCC1-like thiol-disulfide oxidoreductase family protein [Nocardioides sp.]
MTNEMRAAIKAGRARGPVTLTVLYDDRCPLCRQLKAWMGTQTTCVSIRYVAAASDEARRRYPDLDHERTTTVLTVVDSGGWVYEGERAWLVCAWALPRWQPLAENFRGPVRRHLVRTATRAVDAYRHRLLRSTYGEACDTCRVTAPPRNVPRG